jgi:hypothetical protein
MVIRLASDIEAAIEREARQRGVAPEELAADSLGKLFSPGQPAECPSEEESLADFLVGYAGTVAGSGKSNSIDCGRSFAEGMAAKREQGRL